MNDKERESWILNDEDLYRWYKASGESMRKFIRENRKKLDTFIETRMNKGGG